MIDCTDCLQELHYIVAAQQFMNIYSVTPTVLTGLCEQFVYARQKPKEWDTTAAEDSQTW